MTSSAPPVPIADRLFTWPSEDPQLIASRCAECSCLTFPVSTGCPRCGSDQLADELLATTGTLWTWTSQGFLPKDPYSGPEQAGDFEPWGVGSVELTGQLRVEARLVGCRLDQLQIGMP